MPLLCRKVSHLHGRCCDFKERPVRLSWHKAIAGPGDRGVQASLRQHWVFWAPRLHGEQNGPAASSGSLRVPGVSLLPKGLSPCSEGAARGARHPDGHRNPTLLSEVTLSMAQSATLVLVCDQLTRHPVIICQVST